MVYIVGGVRCDQICFDNERYVGWMPFIRGEAGSHITVK